MVASKSSGQTGSRATDSLVMVAFYDATDGDSWCKSTGWKTAPFDQWHVVTLTNNRVSKFDLR